MRHNIIKPTSLVLITVTVIVLVFLFKLYDELRFDREKKAPAEIPDVEQFHRYEVVITLPEELTVDDSTRFDAYDADNDGRYVRASCVFTHVKTGNTLVVPAFFAKDTPDGAWNLKCRFSPNASGRWRYTSLVGYGLDGNEKVDIGKEKVFLCGATKETGPIVKSAKNSNPNYLYRLNHSGEHEVFWGMPVVRPWVVEDVETKNFSEEWMDRETELFAPMREYGCNILYMWMAPWELLICHKSPAEYWQIMEEGRYVDGTFEEHPLEEPDGWRSYSYYDQGRAMAMDRIIEMAEYHDDRSGGPIYLFLAFMPHQSFATRKGQWDAEYSDEELSSRQGEPRHKLFGLADFKRRMVRLDWFRATPDIDDRDDWRRQYWDWQANFARYVIARWGYSRSLGMWVIMDELDMMNPGGSRMDMKTGWWSTPECNRWHDDFLRMFRGELEGYDGDPFNHPITSSTLQYNPDTGEEVNGIWDGGDVKVDVVTYHSYPAYPIMGEWVTVDGRHVYEKMLEDDEWKYYGSSNTASSRIPADTSTWAHAAKRIHDWSIAVGPGRPKMITESGFIERPTGVQPPDIYGKKYPTVYHYQVWTSLVCGNASAVSDWNDGKEFGEMSWRDREGHFSKENYPINLYAELRNTQRFIDDEDISRFEQFPDGNISATEGLTAWCIADDNRRLLGWVFIDSEHAIGRDDLSVTITGLCPEAKYEVQWYNTWTGARIGEAVRLQNDLGTVVLDTGGFLRRSIIEPEEGPNNFEDNPNDWHDDGKDAAFKIVQR